MLANAMSFINHQCVFASTALEILTLDLSLLEAAVDLASTFTMKFNMPLLEKDFSAFGDIILESYGALEGDTFKSL